MISCKYISLLQDFVIFKSFLRKKRRKNRPKGGSKCSEVNEGKFVLNINVSFVVEFYLKLKLILRIITYLTYICLGNW
jgi:hypothetical protein